MSIGLETIEEATGEYLLLPEPRRTLAESTAKEFMEIQASPFVKEERLKDLIAYFMTRFEGEL